MTSNSNDHLQFGQDILNSQPFSQLLGATLTGFAEGFAEISLPITPQLKQQFDYVHGGVISYAADNALTFAGGSVLGPQVLTQEYKLNYVRPAQGETLIARATVIASTKRQAVCRCEVLAVSVGEEILCAVGLGTIVKIGA